MGKIEAIYTVSQPTVLTEAEVFKNLYHTDHADFEAKDPAVFVLTYEADFAALILAAIATGTDESYMDTVQAETEDVEAKIEECRQYIQNTLRYWVVKIWGEGSGTFNSFGFDDYKKVDKSHEKMVGFMNNVKNRVASNSAALLSGGMSAPDIAKASTLAGQIMTEKGEQKTAIKIREEQTDIRITAYNAVWKIMLQLNQASKMVYASDPSHMALYNMPEKDEIHTYSNVVLKGKTVNIFRRTMLPTDQLKIESLTSGLLKFCLAPDDVTACDLVGVEVHAGSEITVTVSQLGDIAVNKYLNVTNKDLVNDGEYRVTVL